MLLMIMLQEVISQLLVAAMKSTKQACPRSAEQLVFLVVLGFEYIWTQKKFYWLAQYQICLSVLGTD